MAEDSQTARDVSQGEDGEDESMKLNESSEEQSMEKVEAIEGKRDEAATKPQRRASTPPPPNIPIKLLTRLGSLDGEFTQTSPCLRITNPPLTVKLSEFICSLIAFFFRRSSSSS